MEKRKELFLVMKLLTKVAISHEDGKIEHISVGGVRGIIPVYNTEKEANKVANGEYDVLKIQIK